MPHMEIHPDDHPTHLAGDLHELLAEEAGELGVQAALEGDVVVLTGEVQTAERRAELEELVTTNLPGATVDNRVQVVMDELGPPDAEEHV